jgi:hypothetical protein
LATSSASQPQWDCHIAHSKYAKGAARLNWKRFFAKNTNFVCYYLYS